MKRKVLIPGLAIAATAAIVAGGTFAQYLDKEESPIQSVSAGTLDVRLTGSAIDAPVLVSNVMPGYTSAGDGGVSNPEGFYPDKQIKIVNDGTLNATVKVFVKKLSDAENGIQEPEAEAGDTTDPAGELSKNLTVHIDGFVGAAQAFKDAAVGDVVEYGTFELPAGADSYRRVYWAVPGSTGNEIMSDSTSFKVMFEAVPSANQVDPTP